MKTLVWKDFRQNLRILLAVSLFLAIPYLIALIFGLVALMRLHVVGEPMRMYGPGLQNDGSGPAWMPLIAMASAWTLALSAIAAAFIGGNMFAGERADRSAEFLAYLPIQRNRALASKVIVAVGMCLGLMIVNLVIGSLCGLWQFHDIDFREFVAAMCVTAPLTLGVSWWFSTFLRTPAIAAACGVFAPIFVAGLLMFFDFVSGSDEAVTLARWYTPIVLPIGIAAFVGGSVYVLRRNEP